MDDVRRLIHLPEELLLIIAGYLSFQDCILLHEVNKLLNSIFHQFMIMKYKGIKKDFRNKDRLPMVQFYHLVKVYISNLSQLDNVSLKDSYESKVVFKVLEKNTSLKFLNFAGCNTKSFEAEFDRYFLEIILSNVILLSTALKRNKSVIILDLYRNNLEDEAAIAIATALKINKTLTKLSFHDNRICDDGAKAIASALETNITLINLSLAFNMIGTEGIYTLATALKINTTLTRLDFSGNKGIGAGYGLIREILKTGRKIKIPGANWLR
jgi:hypothetical protein